MMPQQADPTQGTRKRDGDVARLAEMLDQVCKRQKLEAAEPQSLAASQLEKLRKRAAMMKTQTPASEKPKIPFPKAFIDTVVLAMERNPLSLKVQLEGCSVLRCHTKASGSMDRNSLSVILSALLRNHTNAMMRCIAVDSLRYAARDETSRAMMAAHSGCVSTILSALEVAPTDGQLQEIGLTLLSYLVEDADCRRQLLEDGGVDAIISAMKNHASNPLIHCNGAAALCWLVHLDHEAASAALTENADAIPTIYRVSKEFLSNASVLGNCMCILFGVLVSNGKVLEDHPELGGATVRDLIQSGMRKHPEVIKVQRNSLMLLRLVAEAPEDNAEGEEKLRSYSHCIQVIVECMKEFPLEVDMQYLGSRILASLAANANIRKEIMATSGCINQVTAALVEHKDDARVQRAALCFLNELLGSNVNEEATEAFRGGISVLKDMLEGLGVLDDHHA